MKKNNHIVWIRVIAILSVVLLHCAEVVYGKGKDWNSVNFVKLSHITRIVLITCYNIGRTFGPPFFMMISGYLLLDRDWDSNKIKSFYKKNWIHLFICTIIWFLIYDIFLIFYCGAKISVSDVIKDLLLLNKVQMMNAWYMPMILGLYPLIPFVALSLSKIEKRNIIICFLFYCFIIVVIPTVNSVLKTIKVSAVTEQINYGFSGGIYGLYLIAGYIIKKGYLLKINISLRAIVGTLLFVLLILFMDWRITNRDYSGIWYDNIFVFISSIMVFSVLVENKSFDIDNRLMTSLSKYSFAVYLIHIIVIKILYELFSGLSLKLPVIVLLFTSASIAISYISAWFIEKIPRIGKYLLYIK